MADVKSTGSWLDPPELHGKKNADGTFTLAELELKKLNDYNRKVAKMLQGGLNLANLNKETNQVFSDIEGNVTEISETAAGLTISVSNLGGEVSTISATVNGLSIADETGSYTIIDGDRLISKDHDTSVIVEIEDGTVRFKSGSTNMGEIYGNGVGITIEPHNGLILSGDVQVGQYGNVDVNGSAVRLLSYGNMSLNSSGTTYIGTNASYSGDVSIGQVGGTINLVGTVNVNGVPI